MPGFLLWVISGECLSWQLDLLFFPPCLPLSPPSSPSLSLSLSLPLPLLPSPSPPLSPPSSPSLQVKKVHEQLKALSNSNPSKKRRKSLAPLLDMTDPLFLPSAVNSPPAAPPKKKPKKKAVKAAPTGDAVSPVKKPKARSTPAAPPAKKPTSK